VIDEKIKKKEEMEQFEVNSFASYIDVHRAPFLVELRFQILLSAA
jgi:hypothetical protein